MRCQSFEWKGQHFKHFSDFFSKKHPKPRQTGTAVGKQLHINYQHTRQKQMGGVPDLKTQGQVVPTQAYLYPLKENSGCVTSSGAVEMQSCLTHIRGSNVGFHINAMHFPCTTSTMASLTKSWTFQHHKLVRESLGSNNQGVLLLSPAFGSKAGKGSLFSRGRGGEREALRSFPCLLRAFEGAGFEVLHPG